ncbi:helix-hairpin-helix domain-containing protein [Streptomyces sp. NPDC049879]|uniref:helix-hairpin-helix domain-containing protein n=1 Tax=Streptomyces sp. NPDC049879 TaxID=3365598 RepID=UPI0037A010CE
MADGTEELLRMANVGPAVVRRLARVGVTAPADLRGRDPYEMYERLCALDGRRHDPCLLDTFLSVVDQAGGGEPRPWWTYTQERKRHG